MMRELFSSRGEQGATPQLQHVGFSLRRLLGVEHRLRGTGTSGAAPGLQSTGSVVAVPRLSCSVACAILPGQGWKPCLLHCLSQKTVHDKEYRVFEIKLERLEKLYRALQTDGYVLEPTEWLKGSQTSSGVWREDTGLLSRQCRK